MYNTFQCQWDQLCEVKIISQLKIRKMNFTNPIGNLYHTKDELIQKFLLLTDSDLLLLEDKQDEILNKLRAKYGNTKEKIHKFISEA
jgi:hypothetical protein